MWRLPYNEDWERNKSYLYRNSFENLLELSTIYESDNESTSEESTITPNRYEALFTEHGRSSPLPDLIIEKIPKTNKHDEPDEYYEELEIKVLKYIQKVRKCTPSERGDLRIPLPSDESDWETSSPCLPHVEHGGSGKKTHNLEVTNEELFISPTYTYNIALEKHNYCEYNIDTTNASKETNVIENIDDECQSEVNDKSKSLSKNDESLADEESTENVNALSAWDTSEEGNKTKTSELNLIISTNHSHNKNICNSPNRGECCNQDNYSVSNDNGSTESMYTIQVIQCEIDVHEESTKKNISMTNDYRCQTSPVFVPKSKQGGQNICFENSTEDESVFDHANEVIVNEDHIKYGAIEDIDVMRENTHHEDTELEISRQINSPIIPFNITPTSFNKGYVALLNVSQSSEEFVSFKDPTSDVEESLTNGQSALSTPSNITLDDENNNDNDDNLSTRDIDSDAPEAVSAPKKIRREDVSVQTNRETLEWADVYPSFFVGTPQIYRLCKCKNHICSV